MLLAQIEAFVAIVQHGTVLRAAEALCLSQPALTARVQGLEQELGQQLFARVGRGLRLTEAGRAFLPYAERALRVVAEGRTVLAGAGDAAAGRLALGATVSLGSYLLPGALERFRATHPQVKLIVRSGTSLRIAELVLGEVVQLGLLRERPHRDLANEPLYETALALVTPPHHPFALRGLATLAEIAAEPLVLLDRASSSYEETSALFVQAGLRPRIAMEVDDFQVAKEMIAVGFGLGLLPPLTVAREVERGQLATVRIADGQPRPFRIVVARRADVGPPGATVAAFLQALRETVHDRLGAQAVVRSPVAPATRR